VRIALAGVLKTDVLPNLQLELTFEVRVAFAVCDPVAYAFNSDGLREGTKALHGDPRGNKDRLHVAVIRAGCSGDGWCVARAAAVAFALCGSRLQKKQYCRENPDLPLTEDLKHVRPPESFDAVVNSRARRLMAEILRLKRAGC